MEINARLISSDLLPFLNCGSIQGVVHSVFEKACNIKLENNKLITLVTSGLANLPSSIKLDVGDACSFMHIPVWPDMEVRMNSKELVFKRVPLSIGLEGAKVWDAYPKFIKSNLSQDTVRRNLNRVREITLNYGSRDGLAPILDMKYANRLVSFVLPYMESLNRALKQQDDSLIREISGKLIGFGPGLTPSADDLLLGVMASLFYLGNYFGYSLSRIEKLTHSLIYGIKGRTTAISQAMLQNGANGLFHESLRNLMLAVTSREEVGEECFELLKTGETSGSDCAAGVVLGGSAVMGMNGVKGVVK